MKSSTFAKKMQYIKVTSFQHLEQLIKQGMNEFVSRCGVLSSSMSIDFSSDPDFPYEIFSYVDGSTVNYSREELETFFMNRNGKLYAEKWNNNFLSHPFLKDWLQYRYPLRIVRFSDRERRSMSVNLHISQPLVRASLVQLFLLLLLIIAPCKYSSGT